MSAPQTAYHDFGALSDRHGEDRPVCSTCGCKARYQRKDGAPYTLNGDMPGAVIQDWCCRGCDEDLR